MSRVQISAEAEGDIDQIAAHTLATWGWRQTNKFLAKLEDGFELLAQNPSIGRSCEPLHAGLQRFEIGMHVIFYISKQGTILIVRVLHQDMLPDNYI